MAADATPQKGHKRPNSDPSPAVVPSKKNKIDPSSIVDDELAGTKLVEAAMLILLLQFSSVFALIRFSLVLFSSMSF